jgi:hypothetical protein
MPRDGATLLSVSRFSPLSVNRAGGASGTMAASVGPGSDVERSRDPAGESPARPGVELRTTPALRGSRKPGARDLSMGAARSRNHGNRRCRRLPARGDRAPAASAHVDAGAVLWRYGRRGVRHALPGRPPAHPRRRMAILAGAPVTLDDTALGRLVATGEAARRIISDETAEERRSSARSCSTRRGGPSLYGPIGSTARASGKTAWPWLRSRPNGFGSRTRSRRLP